MALRFYNTLSGRVEDFSPLEKNQIRFYTCGPTVYDFAHIGNYRTFVFQDILRRFLEYRGYEVRQVMNLTDVDDKTIRNSRAAGMTLRDYTAKFIEAFEIDRSLLNLEAPEIVVRATDHIDNMVKLIQTLIEKGYAYSSEGSVYFSVKQFKDYGKLSKIDFSGIRSGARVDSDEYEKDNARDFVLWKAAKEGEPRWETPLGPGRPGWHIECSVMSMKYLGESFDIHSGGSDLIFPHHENEIAQSEAATGKPFVRFWLHAEHLMVNGEKMAKSQGNFYTLRDLIAQGYKPSAIRYLLASAHFRMPLNFTFEGLHQAKQSVERLRNFRSRLTTEKFPVGESEELRTRAETARQTFDEALDDNLNTAAALAAVFDLVREGNTAMDQGKFLDGNRPAFQDVLERWDRIFAVLNDDDYEKLIKYGLAASPAVLGDGQDAPVQQLLQRRQQQSYLHPSFLQSVMGVDGPVFVPETMVSEEDIKNQIAAREAARRRGEYARADEIRGELLNAGVILEDTKAGTRWKRK